MLRFVSLFFALSILGPAAAAQRPVTQRPTAQHPAKTRHQVTATADSGTFIVVHGRDTVATEQFGRTAAELHGALELASLAHGIQQYLAVIAPDATVPVVEITVRMASDSGPTTGRIVQRARVIFKDDSAAVDALTDHGIETHLFATQRGAVPYLNLSFALLEQAVRRARALKKDRAEVPFFNLGGGETAVGKFAPIGADSLAFTIGEIEYRLQVDSVGRLLGGQIPKQDVLVLRR